MKQKKWWQYLLWLPAIFALDALALGVTSYLEVDLPVLQVLYGVTGTVLVWAVYQATRSFLQDV